MSRTRRSPRARARRARRGCGRDRFALPDLRPDARRGHGRRAPRLDAVNDERENHPSFLKMIGLVAASVAITILVFFGIGYALGRIFL